MHSTVVCSSCSLFLPFILILIAVYTRGNSANNDERAPTTVNDQRRQPCIAPLYVCLFASSPAHGERRAGENTSLGVVGSLARSLAIISAAEEASLKRGGGPSPCRACV